MEEFDKFWELYPRKAAKGDARKAWIQTAKIRPPLPELLKSIYAARASKQWLKDGGDYIPYPATWLRQERWSDEIEVDLSRLGSPSGKVCAYCGLYSVGMVNGIWHCSAHSLDAMDGKKTNVVTLNATVLRDKKLESAGS